MENSFNYNPNSIGFIKIFSRILVGFLCCTAACLYFLSLNDSVSSSDGEFISLLPQKDYNAPFEATLDSIFVKEGDKVLVGDTLVKLSNKILNKDNFQQSTVSQNMTYTQSVARNAITNCLSKREHLNEKIAILSEQNRINNLKNKEELSSLLRELSNSNERLKLSKANLNTDSTLFKEGVISKLKLAESYDKFLASKNKNQETKNKINQHKLNGLAVNNLFKNEKNNLQVEILALEEKLNGDKETLQTAQNNQKSIAVELEYYQGELNKQYIIADIDGVVGKVFNRKRVSNLIRKNEFLLSVSPVNNSFVARVVVPQKDVWQLKIGQPVNLKIDAYYYYQHGITKAKVSYISERKDENSQFYVLAELQNENEVPYLRSGYTMTGEIIVEKLQLWEYIIKKTFRNMCNQEEEKLLT